MMIQSWLPLTRFKSLKRESLLLSAFEADCRCRDGRPPATEGLSEVVRIPVRSSSIKSVGFDSATCVMEVEFQDGEIYHYCEVPNALYEALIASTSIGLKFNESVRNEYVCVRVTETETPASRLRHDQG